MKKSLLALLALMLLTPPAAFAAEEALDREELGLTGSSSSDSLKAPSDADAANDQKGMKSNARESASPSPDPTQPVDGVCRPGYYCMLVGGGYRCQAVDRSKFYFKNPAVCESVKIQCQAEKKIIAPGDSGSPMWKFHCANGNV